MPKQPFDILMNLIIAAAVGFVVAKVVTGIMKGKLKTVRFQAGAGSYVKAGSMNVTESRDLFLFANVTRSPRPKESSSGGSSTHTSSSGSSHGGGGGKF